MAKSKTAAKATKTKATAKTKVKAKAKSAAKSGKSTKAKPSITSTSPQEIELMNETGRRKHNETPKVERQRDPRGLESFGIPPSRNST